MNSVADRLAALFDHLGLQRAFMATQMPGDIAEFCSAHPERIAGLALIVASRIAPAAAGRPGDGADRRERHPYR
ncbi:MAG: hypothetical protein O3B74_04350, partial [Proteobacteria bacterium]|nr:hypothetical protein [Pseudomonadota bacterium]